MIITSSNVDFGDLVHMFEYVYSVYGDNAVHLSMPFSKQLQML